MFAVIVLAETDGEFREVSRTVYPTLRDAINRSGREKRHFTAKGYQTVFSHYAKAEGYSTLFLHSKDQDDVRIVIAEEN